MLISELELEELVGGFHYLYMEQRLLFPAKHSFSLVYRHCKK